VNLFGGGTVSVSDDVHAPRPRLPGGGHFDAEGPAQPGCHT